MNGKVSKALNIRRGYGGTTESNSGRTTVSSALNARKERMKGAASEKITSIVKRLNDEISNVEKNKRPSWGTGSYKQSVDLTRSNRTNIDDLRKEAEAYRNYIDEDTMNSIIDSLDWLDGQYNSYLEGAKLRENFENEAEYNTAVKEYTIDKQYRNKYQGKTYAELQRDLELLKGKTELKGFTPSVNGNIIGSSAPSPADIAEYQWLKSYAESVKVPEDYQNDIYNVDTKIKQIENDLAAYDTWKLQTGEEVQSNYREFANKYGTKAKAEHELELLKKEKANYEAKIKYGYVGQKADFEKYAAEGAAIVNPTMAEAEGKMSIGNKRIGGKEVGNIVTYSRDNAAELAMGEVNGSSLIGKSLYSKMYDEEVNIYNYLLAKYGKDEAQLYLDSLEEELNYRSGTEMGKRVRSIENPIARAAATGVVGATAGLDQWASGVKQLVNEEGLPVSELQYASGYIREDIDSAIGKGAYDLVTTTANMAPSILVSTILGGAGAPKAVAQVAGGVTLGASAAGNAYAEAKRMGYTTKQARNYGVLVGASETALQYILGGISSLGGSVTNNIVAKSVQNIDNALLKFAVETGINMAGEGAEEYLQEILNPVFRNLMLGEDNEVKLVSEEAVYSFLLGALSAGVIEGGGNAVGKVAQNNYYKDIYGDSSEELVNESLELEPEYAYGEKMKARLDKGKKLTGNQIGNLVEHNNDIIRKGDVAAISQRLTELGENGNVNEIASAIVKREAGEELTRAEQRMISKSMYGEYVSKERAEVSPEETIPDEINDAVRTASKKTNEAAQTVVPINAPKEDIKTKNAVLQSNATESKAVEVKGDVITTATDKQGKSVGIKGYNENGDLITTEGIVPTEDLTFDNPAYADVVEDAKAYKGSEDLYIQAFSYMPNNVNPVWYGRAFNNFYTAGSLLNMGIEFEGRWENDKGVYSNIMSKDYAKLIFETARRLAIEKRNVQSLERDTEKRQNKPKKKKKGKVHNPFDSSTLTERQRVSVETVERIAEAIGTEVYFYASYLDENKVRVYKNSEGKIEKAPNGFYDPKDGSIHLDINAGDTGKSLILYTAAHELTHLIKDISAVKFDTLADFLMEQYHKKGVDIAELIDAQIEKARENDREIDYDTAYEEVVADSMETMLADGRLVEKLQELNKRDKGIVKKIADYFKKLAEKIRAVYEKMTPESREGQLVAEMVEETERLQGLFFDALKDVAETGVVVSENYSKSEPLMQFRGFTKDGRRVYESDFDADVPMDDRIDVFKDRISTIFNLGAVELNTDVKKIKVQADKFTAQKNIYGDDLATDDEMNAKASALFDLADILETSTYLPNKTQKEVSYANPNVPPKNKAHKGVKYWYKFQNEIVFDGVPYTVTFNIRDKGKEQYEYLIDFKENKAPYLSNTVYKDLLRAGKTPYNIRIHANSEIVKGVKQKKQSGNSNNNLHSDRASSRSMLASALEQFVQSEEEHVLLNDYISNIDKMEADERRLAELREEINDMQFSKGQRDTEFLDKLAEKREEARKITAKLTRYDESILKLEGTQTLKTLISRERTAAARLQKQKDAKAKERAARRREIAETRRKTLNIAHGIESLLSRETKNRNIKDGMKDVGKRLLSLSKFLFEDVDDNADIARMGIEGLDEDKKKMVAHYVELSDRRDALKAEEKNIRDDDSVSREVRNERLEAFRNEHRAEREAISKEISRFNSVEPKEIFARERRILNKRSPEKVIEALETAYKGLRDSQSEHIKDVYSDLVLEKITSLKEDLKEVVAGEMTLSQTQSVYEVFKMVKHAISQADKLFADNKSGSLSNTVANVHKEIDVYKHDDKRIGAMISDKFSTLNKFSWNNLKPGYAFRRIGSKTLEKLFMNLAMADGTWARDIDEARTFIEETREKYGYKKWNIRQTKTFTMADGRELVLTLGNMQAIYAYSKREQALDHMRIGGFKFVKGAKFGTLTQKGANGKYEGVKERTDRGDTYRMTTELINDIVNSLSPEQKQYVDALQEYMSNELASKGNSVSMKLFGIELFKEKNYMPIQSVRAFLNSVKVDVGAVETMVSLKNTGMTKPTKPHAENPIVLKEFEDFVFEHIDTMAKYHAYVLPIEDMQRVFNAGTYTADNKPISTKSEIEAVYGGEARVYFENYIRDLNGGNRGGALDSLPMMLFSRMKKNAVAASLSVAIQQPFAITRAMAMIDPKYFVGTKGKTDNNISSYKEMRKYAPITIVKEIGGYDMGSSRSATEFIGRTKYGIEKAGSAIDKVSMALPELMDRLGWSAIWIAVKNEVADTNKDLKVGSQEFFEKCNERFTEVITYTQVYDSVNSRSGLMRSKSELDKFATSFAGEPTTYINMLFDAWNNLYRSKYHGDRAGAWKKVGRTVVVLGVTSLLTKAAVSLVYAMRDDDEDEAYWEKYMQALGEQLKAEINPLNSIPYARDIISIIKGWDVERPDLTVISDMVTSGKRLWKAISDKDTSLDTVMKFADALGNVCNVPIKNVRRDAMALWRAGVHIFDDKKSDNLLEEFWNGVSEGTFFESTNDAKIKKVAKFVDRENYEGAAAYISDWVSDKALELAEKDGVSEEDFEKYPYNKNKYTDKAKDYIKSLFREKYKDEYLDAVEKKDVKTVKKIKVILYNTRLYAEKDKSGNEINDIDAVFTDWRKSAFKKEYKDACGTGDEKEMKRIEAAVRASGFYKKPDKTLKNWREAAEEIKDAEE